MRCSTRGLDLIYATRQFEASGDPLIAGNPMHLSIKIEIAGTPTGALKCNRPFTQPSSAFIAQLALAFFIRRRDRQDSQSVRKAYGLQDQRAASRDEHCRARYREVSCLYVGPLPKSMIERKLTARLQIPLFDRMRQFCGVTNEGFRAGKVAEIGDGWAPPSARFFQSQRLDAAEHRHSRRARDAVGSAYLPVLRDEGRSARHQRCLYQGRPRQPRVLHLGDFKTDHARGGVGRVAPWCS